MRYYVRRLICLIVGHKEVKHYDWESWLGRRGLKYLYTQCERCGAYNRD